MSLSQPEIERIVREVVRRLQAAGRAPDLAAARAADARASDDAGQRLDLAERLVTGELLRKRLDGVSRVFVRPDAVVTPLVHDELKQRGIELVRNLAQVDARSSSAGASPSSAVASPRSAAAGPSLVVGICGGKDGGGNGAVERLLQECGVSVEQLLRGDEPTVVPRMKAAMQGGRRRGLLVSSRPAAVACWANRAAQVRGVWGTDAACVARAVREMGANLLVVDPNCDNLPAGLESFVRAGPLDCPEPWRAWLKNGSV